MPFFSPAPNLKLRPMVCVDGAAILLRALAPSSQLAPFMIAYSSADGLFIWDDQSLAADDGATIIKPTDVGVFQKGRWLSYSITLQPLPPYVFSLDGPYQGAHVPGFFGAPIYCSSSRTISKVQLLRRTCGDAGSTRVNIYVNGVELMTAGNQPIVLAGDGDYANAASTTFVAGVNILGAGDIVECALMSAETGELSIPEGIHVSVEF